MINDLSVTIVDENTREFIEETSGGNFGTYAFTWKTRSNLTGRLLDGKSVCIPAAGTFSATYQTSPGSTITLSANKDIDEPYWRVASVEQSNITTNGVDFDDPETTEYFVRELKFIPHSSTVPLDAMPDDIYFICDFADF